MDCVLALNDKYSVHKTDQIHDIQLHFQQNTINCNTYCPVDYYIELIILLFQETETVFAFICNLQCVGYSTLRCFLLGVRKKSMGCDWSKMNSFLLLISMISHFICSVMNNPLKSFQHTSPYYAKKSTLVNQTISFSPFVQACILKFIL